MGLLSARLPAATVLAALLVGCSSFERDWQAAGADLAPVVDPIRGRWEGSWRSDVSGHEGALRCLVSASEDGSLVARYRAEYGCCFSFEYSVPMVVEREDDACRFTGSADLGWLAGGVYHYEGRADGKAYTSTYTSEDDHGTFTLARPGEGPGTN
ncbi:MAG TPA: hypothetical protein VMT52_03570 [Planctomycetota bacterium]|nr:hypothetical protein [Planctomycetota bacterium]